MMEAARLGFDPLAPWPVLWGLIAVSAALWMAYIFLRGKAWLVRALAFATLVAALLNPLWIREEREPLKDIVALVLDRSESMRFGDRSSAAQQAFDTVKADLEADESIELRIAETDTGADGTDLYQALNAALADAPRERIGGSILITDGQAHDIPATPKDARTLGPVHALVVGAPDEQDRRIEILTSPNFGIVGDTAEMTVRVDDPDAARVQVRISVNGETLTPRMVFTGEDAPIRLDIPRRGPNLVVVEVEPGDNELTLANNRTAANITGVHDRLRVLLVTGEPHAGARVWRDLLKSDPSVDLVHFTILRPPLKMDPTPIDELALISFPTRELFVEKLKDFDLIIFDRYRRINVLPMIYFDRVARYVADGGALLVAVGPPYSQPQSIYRTPLAAILPARPTGGMVEKTIQLRRTPLGERHTVTAALSDEENWGPWERYVDTTAQSGETLLEADTGAPLLVLDRVGEGRVAQLLSDQLWLWARDYEGGGPYAELVRRTAHWLMQEPELEEEILSLTADGDTMSATLRSLDETPPPLVLTDPDGSSVTTEWRQREPGVFEATLPAPRLGLYAATSGDLSTVALNGPANPREYVDVRSTTEVLAPMADATRGGVFRVRPDGDDIQTPALRRVGANGAAAGQNWIGLRRRDAYSVRASEATSLLPGLTGVLLVLGLMLLAWRREGR